ncbi:hypothetical protein ACERII_22890 [Evansella sp. AB-rgal1]|uniref:hypothetical protein n=1 Tax=Evansella sp. AB-rgal1 TaxID=3242696 RepID=UPI00359D1814
MENYANYVDLGEVIAVSRVFELNTFQMVKMLESDEIEVYESKEAFMEKYGDKERYEEFDDWCELNNGKVFAKVK